MFQLFNFVIEAISNVVKYSDFQQYVGYLSKGKITDFKKYFKKYKYTKTHYSNLCKYNLLLVK